MPKINILPAKVYNRIAAGEVVDRPYSVVKELVENAIDAGATEIEIFIEQGGKQLIRVSDNGCGIEREDLHSAFLPHATSKIEKAEDLENILTLGFRGEAIASIAAVSQMTITSKTKEGKCYSLQSNGGELGQITEAIGGNGTDVCVEMLFFNTPVRLGFLKSDKAEESDITTFVSRFILCRPDIAFSYYANGKKILQSFGGGVAEAIVGVYGASTLSQCIEIDANKHGIRVRGYLGNQNFFKANKTYQNVFLNGRFVQNATISAAVGNAYSGYMMKRQYPFYVLYIDVPTEVVDVNVHPNKSDVRFADNKTIYGCIYSVVSAVLDGQTKALEYVVSPPVEKKLPKEEKSVETVDLSPSMESPKIQTDKFFTMPDLEELMADMGRESCGDIQIAEETPFERTPIEKAEKKTESLPKEEKVFGFTTLTYEEAQKELASCKPVFPSRVDEYVRDKDNPRAKGFYPIDEIEEYVPESLGGGLATFDKSEKELQGIFPKLFFEQDGIEVYDDAYAKRKKPLETAEAIFAENKRMIASKESNAKFKINVEACTYVGKMFNTYIMYEHGNDVYIIDQHAAHERLIYDRLKRQVEARAVVQQPLLIPYPLPVNAMEKEFLSEHLVELQEMGFELQETGALEFEVVTIPVELQGMDIGVFFNEVLFDIKGYQAIRLVDILKDKLASAACKAAVKGGMDLTLAEVDALFELMDGNMGLKCPHGRPVVVKLTQTELEKMFKRIV